MAVFSSGNLTSAMEGTLRRFAEALAALITLALRGGCFKA
jgi:hypothetical protein